MTFGEDVARDMRERVKEEWEEPLPLGHQGKPPVFPAHRLPPWLNEYVVALATALQVPIDLPALLVLAVLATAAGGRAKVEIRDGWLEPLNLFVSIAMPPGSRKTPAYMRITRPLMDHERAAAEESKAEVSEARVRQAIAKADALRAQTEAEKASPEAREEAAHFAAAQALMAEAITVPVIPRLMVDDATPEALTSIMAEQGGRIGMFSDEGDVFSMMAGRYSSKGPNLAIYLKGHVGSPIRVDRKNRDPEFIGSPALTLGLTVQPEILKSLMAIEGARGRGLLGRFLWAVPPSNIGFRLSSPDPVPAAVDATYQANVRLIVASLAEWTDPIPLVFTEDAARALVAFQDRLEPRLREFGGDLGHIADWASKLIGHTARIAGLLHLATHIHGRWAGQVQADVVADAIAIADWLIAHALIAFEAMSMGPLADNAMAVMRWAANSGRSTFTRRDVQLACRHRFADVSELKEALGLLEANGYLSRQATAPPAASGGRPRGPKYRVNPLFKS